MSSNFQFSSARLFSNIPAIVRTHGSHGHQSHEAIVTEAMVTEAMAFGKCTNPARQFYVLTEAMVTEAMAFGDSTYPARNGKYLPKPWSPKRWLW
eukprot:g124.t1